MWFVTFNTVVLVVIAVILNILEIGCARLVLTDFKSRVASPRVYVTETRTSPGKPWSPSGDIRLRVKVGQFCVFLYVHLGSAHKYVTFPLPEGERGCVFIQPPFPQALVPAPEVSNAWILNYELWNFFCWINLFIEINCEKSNQAKRGTFYHHGDNNQGRRRRWGPAVVAVMFLLNCVFIWLRSDHSEIENGTW